MNKLFEKIKKRIALNATEACNYRENNRVISESELKYILEEEFFKHNNGWIPVKKAVPKHTENVMVTAINNKRETEVAVGWYENYNRRWKVCFDDDQDFRYAEVVAWKEKTEEPYQPEDSKKTNADRIRSMTDEELAAAIFKNTARTIDEIIPFCKNTENCQNMLDSLDGIPECMCRECVWKWLQNTEGGVPG